MDDRAIDLARQLVAHPRWRWMPGMRCVASLDVFLTAVRLVDGGSWVPMTLPDPGVATDSTAGPGWVPDFADPATVGALWGEVRTIWPCAYVIPPCHQACLSDEDFVLFERRGGQIRGRSATYSEAVAQALLETWNS